MQNSGLQRLADYRVPRAEARPRPKFWLPDNAHSPASLGRAVTRPNNLIELPGNTGRVIADSSSAETAEQAAKQTESRAPDFT